MAFVTGNANTMADLLLAIQNACTANGWTLSGNVLHKGTCYMEVIISGIGLLQVEGGTGIDGSNNLTGRSNASPSAIGVAFSLTSPSVTISFTFPLTYFIHINTAPDEVYIIANYATSYYQTLAFGQSQMPGLGASGNWYAGCSARYATQSMGGYSLSGGYHYSSSGTSELFCAQYSDDQGVDYSLDGTESWHTDANNTSSNMTNQDWSDLFRRQPNAWNGESILIPIRVYAPRTSGYFSPVLECAHARHLSIQNVTDQQVITIGADKWKVYPWWHRGPNFTSGQSATSSYYCGHAFRYDGP